VKKYQRIFITSISFTTEDGMNITVVPEMALCNVMEEEEYVEMQIPVITGDLTTHIVLTDQEMRAVQRTALIRESLRAVTRAMRGAR
jgi:hypothetical protein